jgi:CBS domain-containing protein
MFDSVLVREWMTKKVLTVTPHTTLRSAHQLMKEHVIRRLPVVDAGQLVGIVTIGDVREASPSDATSLSIWEVNFLWAQLNVEKVMTHHVITISPDAPILDAAELMLEHKISGLPVVDSQGKLVGILSESDIFRMLVKSRARAIVARPT